jgi:hypothetical protein
LALRLDEINDAATPRASVADKQPIVVEQITRRLIGSHIE